MDHEFRVITALPLRALWDGCGLLPATRRRALSAPLLRELLRRSPVRFMVAEVGARPRWIPESDCFHFWKSEVRPHLAEPDQNVYLERFPGGYCYFADEWQEADGSPIIVLQRCH